jgi:hypothetical protein
MSFVVYYQVVIGTAGPTGKLADRRSVKLPNTVGVHFVLVGASFPGFVEETFFISKAYAQPGTITPVLIISTGPTV